MLFAMHYAKLFETLLNYALHQKYISLDTAAQNKCLFCRNPYLGIQTSLLYWCKSTLITRSLKRREKEDCCKLMQRPRAGF